MSEVNSLKLSVNLLPRSAVYRLLFWLGVLLLPFLLWQSTSDVYTYIVHGAPVGQIWYVFSKLFGLYGVLLLWFQGMFTLLKETKYSILFPVWSLFWHRYFGGLTLVIIIAHIACFVTAVSLREVAFAGGLLLPNFSDFYRASITVGLLGFALALIAVLFAAARRHFSDVWIFVHRLMMLVVLFGLVHSLLIGTETRYGLYEYFYSALILAFLVALLIRWNYFRGRV